MLREAELLRREQSEARGMRSVTLLWNGFTDDDDATINGGRGRVMMMTPIPFYVM